MITLLEKASNKNVHFFFIFLLSLNYIVPLLLFGNITLFYLDALDNEIVNNSILGKILKGNFESVKIFLNGELNIFYLRKIFQPHTIFYALFDPELAYWILDILVKITSYISFFILAKKINNNVFLCALVACFYAAINLPTHEGFGMAIFPYLSYLILFKKNLKFKHYLLTIFFGLNSSFFFTFFAIPVLALSLLLFLKKENFNNFIKILLIFTASIILANSGLIYINSQGIEFHRIEFLRNSYSPSKALLFYFKYLFKIPESIGYSFFLNLPYTIFVLPLFICGFLSKDSNVKKILLIIIISTFFQYFLKIDFIASFINNSKNLLKTFTWDYIRFSYFFLYCFAIIYLLKKNTLISKFLTILIFFVIIISQINSSIVPFVKEKILKIENYQNIYTFKGYYYFHDYASIKKIVGNERTLSVGLDPMVAAMNNIYTIDGYHAIYPLSYKKKFRKIIKKQLEKDLIFKDYYDNYGSRVYTTLFTDSPKEVFIDFKEAKKLNAKFVISKYRLNSNDITLIYGNCEKTICLYEIR